MNDVNLDVSVKINKPGTIKAIETIYEIFSFIEKDAEKLTKEVVENMFNCATIVHNDFFSRVAVKEANLKTHFDVEYNEAMLAIANSDVSKAAMVFDAIITIMSEHVENYEDHARPTELRSADTMKESLGYKTYILEKISNAVNGSEATTENLEDDLNAGTLQTDEPEEKNKIHDLLKNQESQFFEVVTFGTGAIETVMMLPPFVSLEKVIVGYYDHESESMKIVVELSDGQKPVLGVPKDQLDQMQYTDNGDSFEILTMDIELAPTKDIDLIVQLANSMSKSIDGFTNSMFDNKVSKNPLEEMFSSIMEDDTPCNCPSCSGTSENSADLLSELEKLSEGTRGSVINDDKIRSLEGILDKAFPKGSLPHNILSKKLEAIKKVHDMVENLK